MINLSEELLNKIKTDMTICDSMRWKSVSDYSCDYVGTLEFSENEMKLFAACKEWISYVKSHLVNSTEYLKLNQIGRFRGVRPERIYEKYKIYFRVSDYDESSWKDWFEEVDQNYKINGMD